MGAGTIICSAVRSQRRHDVHKLCHGRHQIESWAIIEGSNGHATGKDHLGWTQLWRMYYCPIRQVNILLPRSAVYGGYRIREQHGLAATSESNREQPIGQADNSRFAYGVTGSVGNATASRTHTMALGETVTMLRTQNARRSTGSSDKRHCDRLV
jgi:hypothetical protein